jgi:hypothetical protein
LVRNASRRAIESFYGPTMNLQLLRKLALLPAIGFIFALFSSISATPAERFPVVVELFTSQGCSSCPPADALLGKLKDRRDIVSLSLPVDYWDHLGWKDTLASPANSKRQWDYARARGGRSVYTPQMVINGLVDAAGNDPFAVDAAIDTVRERLAPDRVPIQIRENGDVLTLSAAAGNPDNRHKEATFWLVFYSTSVEVPIKRGENAGKKIRYFNVVREMSPVGIWHGKPVDIELSKRDLRSRGHDGCAVLLQTRPSGPIIGALALSDYF